MRSLLLVALAACLPPDTPARKPAKPDPELAELAHTWTVENHVLAGNASITDGDALANHGRTVAITASSYASMFTGSCDDAARARRERVFADVAVELELAGEARDTAIRFGFGDPIVEYRLTCPDHPRTVPLVIFISGKRAMTCFGGACYLLAS
ncbi:MAG: hypothetical protein ACM31C_30955 [Acidobacteriota bacterium]